MEGSLLLPPIPADASDTPSTGGKTHRYRAGCRQLPSIPLSWSQQPEAPLSRLHATTPRPILSISVPGWPSLGWSRLRWGSLKGSSELQEPRGGWEGEAGLSPRIPGRQHRANIASLSWGQRWGGLVSWSLFTDKIGPLFAWGTLSCWAQPDYKFTKHRPREDFSGADPGPWDSRGKAWPEPS